MVWSRDSAVAGIPVKGKQYDLVQIFDGEGEKLQPAFSDWVAYSEANKGPGVIHYHEARS